MEDKIRTITQPLYKLPITDFCILYEYVQHPLILRVALQLWNKKRIFFFKHANFPVHGNISKCITHWWMKFFHLYFYLLLLISISIVWISAILFCNFVLQLNRMKKHLRCYFNQSAHDFLGFFTPQSTICENRDEGPSSYGRRNNCTFRTDQHNR